MSAPASFSPKLRFVIISGEETEQLTDRVNEWLAAREAEADALRRECGSKSIVSAQFVRFEVKSWAVTTDASFLYWSASYVPARIASV